MIPADLLRQARETAGLSVRALADAAGVSASTVHRIERGDMQPTVEILQRLVETAGERLTVSATPDYSVALVSLAPELARDETNAIRRVAEFVTRFRAANREQQLRMIAVSAKPTGDLRWDAFIAALAEWLAVSVQIKTPEWVRDKNRSLRKPWWVSPMILMQAWEYAGTPAAFQSRGVFIHRDSLVNV